MAYSSPQATFDVGSNTVTLTLQPVQAPLGPFQGRRYFPLNSDGSYDLTRQVSVFPDSRDPNYFVGIYKPPSGWVDAWWFSFPNDPVGDTRKRNTTGLGDYARAIMDAQVSFELVNADDSYSLRDIVEFHPEIATVIMPTSFNWLGENTLQPMNNGVFSFEPQPDWAVEFSDSSGSTVTVVEDESFATGHQVTLAALQHVISEDEVETYSGDFVDPEEGGFVYVGDFQRPDDEVIDTWSMTDSGGAVWSAELIRRFDNIETEGDESTYLIMTSAPRGAGPDVELYDEPDVFKVNQYPNQPDAEAAWDSYKTARAEYITSQINVFLQEIEDESRRGEIWTEDVTGGEWSTRPGASITYSLTYLGEGRYTLSRDGIVVESIQASSDEIAISEATSFMRDDSSPNRKEYSVSSWRTYLDNYEAFSDGLAELPDSMPFSYIWIGGGHDITDSGRTLEGIDYEAGDTRTSGSVQLIARSGYAVRLELRTENTRYFYDNLEGVTGNWADAEVSSVADLDIKSNSTTFADSIIEFTLEGDNRLEIDNDSEFSNLHKLLIETRGERLTVEDAAKMNDEWFLRVVWVKQSNYDTPTFEEDEHDEEEENGNGDDGMTDTVQGLLIAGAAIALIAILVRMTRKRGEE